MPSKKIAILSMFAMGLAACGGGGNASNPTTATSNTPPSAPAPSSSTSSVTINGKITYDFVPHQSQGFGLDYNNISERPAQNIVVQLSDADGNIIDTDITDRDGDYQFSTQPNTQVKVSALAQMVSDGQADWDFIITDNTQNNAVYALSGALTSSGTSSQTRNLHAPSGWDGNSYSQTRAGAPFAILGAAYQSTNLLASVDNNVALPSLEIRWSQNNRAILGDRSIGHIGSSAYFDDIDDGVIYLLGDADSDTDEYDPHVVVHEIGHFIEDKLSRTDTIGGLHGLGDRLDPRLAMSEGFSNAFSAIVLDEPVYKDSSGAGQNSGFSFDIERSATRNQGWFNELSVAGIIYDIYDSNNDEFDHISAGFAPIYEALTHSDFKSSNVFTTIYSFADSITQNTRVNSSDLNILMSGQDIFGQGKTAQGETNNGSILSTIPLYKTAVLDGPQAEICSVVDAGNFNKLGNREYISFSIPQSGTYSLSMQRLDGKTRSDPDFEIWSAGELVMQASNAQEDQESFTGHFEAGEYYLEAYDFFNINGVSARRGDVCFEFGLTST